MTQSKLMQMPCAQRGDIYETMEKEVNAKMELYGMLTSRGKYLNNPQYLEFRQSIWVSPGPRSILF